MIQSRPANFLVLLLLTGATISTTAQREYSPTIHIGDPAPPLRVNEWIKGAPVKQFEKGHVYVLEFWATWCVPCKAAMPHLSALACEYKGKVTIIGIDVHEMKTTTMATIKRFVDSMGQRMDYHVATEDKNYTVADWLIATSEHNNGIPKSIVVNTEGKLAWIGHPKDLKEVLPNIVNRSWDLKAALTKRNEDKHLSKLDSDYNYELMEYRGDPSVTDDLGKPDSMLFAVNEIVKKEPKLKYAPFMAYKTFYALLLTNPQQAYAYGKEVLVTHTYEEPAYDAIIGGISIYSNKINLPPQIYQLGAKAYQLKIDLIVYPETVNIPRLYTSMAEWYWRANDKQKAIDAQQKAVEALKNKHDAEMDAYEYRLQQFKKRKIGSGVFIIHSHFRPPEPYSTFSFSLVFRLSRIRNLASVIGLTINALSTRFGSLFERTDNLNVQTITQQPVTDVQQVAHAAVTLEFSVHNDVLCIFNHQHGIRVINDQVDELRVH